MRKAVLPFPEIGLIAATRAMLGAGIGLLAASHMDDRTRRLVGRTLIAIGALTTIPLALDVFANRR